MTLVGPFQLFYYDSIAYVYWSILPWNLKSRGKYEMNAEILIAKVSLDTR